MSTEYLIQTIEMQKHLIESLNAQLDTQGRQIEKMSQTIANLTETISQLQKGIFGSSSEKSRTSSAFPGQLNLFHGAEEISEPETKQQIEGYTRSKSERKPKSTHEEIYGNLPIEKVVLPVAEEDKICSGCGNPMTHLGEKYVREEIRITPAVITRVQIYQETMICPVCKDEYGMAEIVCADVPEALIPHSMASPSAVSYVMYQKYVMGSPLYRLEKDFEQMGAHISRAVMANWMITCADDCLFPLYDRMHQILIGRDVVGADETTCQVLHEEGKSPQSKSYMWLYQSTVRGEDPIILYEYQPTRGGYHAVEFLKGFHGFLICDGFGGYNRLKDVVRCGCWAHLRRYFFDALPSKKKVDKDNPTPAEIGYAYCNKLFELEKEFKDLDPDERKEKRLEKEPPVLEAFWRWLDTVSAVGGSRLAKAVKYAQNQKPYMENYLKDGRCEISNNLSENFIRPYTVGRKNFLFHNTVEGARTSAVIYSLVLTAKANNLNIQKYLETVLTWMPGCKMGSAGIDELLPWSNKIQEECSLKKSSEQPV